VVSSDDDNEDVDLKTALQLSKVDTKQEQSKEQANQHPVLVYIQGDGSSDEEKQVRAAILLSEKQAHTDADEEDMRLAIHNSIQCFSVQQNEHKYPKFSHLESKERCQSNNTFPTAVESSGKSGDGSYGNGKSTKGKGTSGVYVGGYGNGGGGSYGTGESTKGKDTSGGGGSGYVGGHGNGGGGSHSTGKSTKGKGTSGGGGSGYVGGHGNGGGGEIMLFIGKPKGRSMMIWWWR